MDRNADVVCCICVVRAQTIRRRKTIGCTVKSLRPSNRTNLDPLSDAEDGQSASQMPVSDFQSSLSGNHDDDADVFSKEFPIFGQPETVCVDVSGCGYWRQSRFRFSTLCHSLPRPATAAAADDTSDVAAEHRQLSSWRKTICDVGDVSSVKSRRQLVVFSTVDFDRLSLFRGLTRRKSTSFRRSLVVAGDDGEMTPSLQIHTSRQHKSGACVAGASGERRSRADWRSSGSWRQSLKSLLRGVMRTKSSIDLWATTTSVPQQDTSSSDGDCARKTATNFRRANSLPRSLKTTKRHSGSVAAGPPTRYRSQSVEDQLDSTNQSSRNSFGQEVTSAGERVGRSLSLSRCQAVKGAVSRAGRPQSVEVHIVALDELGRPSSSTAPPTGTALERRVHVSIPEQPWTKPFANVRLRQRSARLVDSDKYRSSSGNFVMLRHFSRVVSLHLIAILLH